MTEFSLLEQLVEESKTDNGYPFQEEKLELLAELKESRPDEFERVRARLKDAGVRVGELDAALRRSGTGAEGGADNAGSLRQADLVISILEDSGIYLFHDQLENAFADLRELDGPPISIRSRGFRLAVRKLVWPEMGAVGSEAVTTAAATLEGRAIHEGPRHELHPRVASKDGELWIDLDGSRAVRVTPGAWRVVENGVPYVFRHYTHQRSLPDPERGGDLKALERHVRLAGKDDRLLLLVYLSTALLPGFPMPAVVFHGVQGSTKSTHLKLVKRLIDPSAVEVRRSIKDGTEFAQAATQNRALFFDNLSSLPEWLSDALCGAVTGDGWSKRALFTDDDSFHFEYQGLVGLGGINLVARKSDLLERSLIFPLEPVPPSERVDEKSFWDSFEADRAKIFGGMLDVLAEAMKIEPSVCVKESPRMADFARWGVAAAIAMGSTQDDFLAAYSRNVDRQNEAAIEANPLAQAVIAMMEPEDIWVGSPSRLLQKLGSVASSIGISTRSQSWPKEPSWLTRRLTECQPNLQSVGITWTAKRSPRERLITIERRAIDDGNVTGNDGKDLDGVIANSLSPLDDDGNDANDSISGTLGRDFDSMQSFPGY